MISFLQRTLVSLLLGAVLGGGALHAQTLPVTKDTFLFLTADNGTKAGEPQGGYTGLYTTTTSNGLYFYMPLLQWDLSGLGVDDVAAGATLSLNYVGRGQGGVSRTLQLVELTAAFDPATTTYNNYIDSSTDPRVGGLSVLDSFTGSFSEPSGVVSFAISGTTLTGWVNNPASNFGVGLFMSTYDRGDVYFASAEHGSVAGPTLALIPEPSAAAALFGALALLGVLGRRRR